LGYTNVAAVTYNVTFDANANGDTVTGMPATMTVASGARISEPPAPSRGSDYTFGGWFKEAECTNGWNFASDTVTIDTPLYAKWIKKVGANIVYYWVNQNKEIATSADSLTLSKAGNGGLGDTFTITADGTGYSAHKWYINGVHDIQTGDTFTFSSAGKVNGKYYLSLSVLYGGKYYSASFTVTVTD